MTVDEIAAEYRRRIIEREGPAVAQILRAYERAEFEILFRLRELLIQIEQDEPTSAMVMAGWLTLQERYTVLLDQIAMQMGALSSGAIAAITAAQSDVVMMAVSAGQEFFEAEGGVARIGSQWNRLPAEALEEFIGRTQVGSPLREVFDQYAPAVGREFEEKIQQALVLGENPREAARQIRQAIEGIPNDALADAVRPVKVAKERALVTARTEIVGAHRSASIRNYAENVDTVLQMRRIAALDMRTCIACWALHGRTYQPGQPIHLHPQCRCTVAPVFETTDPWNNGAQELGARGEAFERELLGSWYAPYKERGLEALVTLSEDAGWGPQARVTPLKDLR